MTLTADHLARTRAAMAAADVDLLLLGREANVRYVSGANRLWLAGTRPFAPSCVVVGDTGAVHVLSVTDDGIPPEIPPGRLYPISWNPMTLVSAAVSAASGSPVRRVGVDGISPLFEQLLATAFADAELLDGEALVREARRVKTSADVDAIRAAIEVAQAMLAAVVAARGDAATRRGVALRRMGELGVTTLESEPLVRVDGDRVAARIAVLRDGWAGTLARTWPRGEGIGRVVTTAAAACRAGTTVSTLVALGVTVEGLGLGHEELAPDERLEAGIVLLVAASDNGAQWADTVLVTEGDPEVLTRA